MSVVYRISYPQEIRCPRCLRVMTSHHSNLDIDYVCSTNNCDTHLCYDRESFIYKANFKLKCISITLKKFNIFLFINNNNIKIIYNAEDAIERVIVNENSKIILDKWLVSNEKLEDLIETYILFS